MKKKILSSNEFPIRNGIRVFWDKSDEFVGINPYLLGVVQKIETTIEWWAEQKVWVRYNVISSGRHLSNGDVEMRIVYSQSNNKHLDAEKSCWGVATIRISPNASSGVAIWDDADYPCNSGETTWELIDRPLLEEKGQERISRAQRRQEQFRKVLLAYDGCCAITGERTVNTLEAAHIIPASEGGSEIIENGILLRADIHRLMDSGVFSIDVNGRIVISKNLSDVDLSDVYKRILTGATINKLIIARVGAALQLCNEKNM